MAAPFLVVEGADYVDKPVCDGDNGVCSCTGTQVVCKKDLPEPARWKDLDNKWVDIYVTMDDRTKLEKGAFDGLSARNLFIQDMAKLSAIEQGTFNGLQLSQELKLYRNPKLATLSKGTFEGLISCGKIRAWNLGITKIEEGAFSGIGFNVAYVYVEENELLTSIEARAFRGLHVNSFQLIKNNKLETLEVSAFEGLASSDWLYIQENNLLSNIKAGAFKGIEVRHV